MVWFAWWVAGGELGGGVFGFRSLSFGDGLQQQDGTRWKVGVSGCGAFPTGRARPRGRGWGGCRRRRGVAEQIRNGVSAAAVSWSYDAEASEVSDDAPTFAGPSIPIYKAQGFVPISMEAMMDASNATQEIGRLLAFGKDVLEASSFAMVPVWDSPPGSSQR
jgi:hypothetical protein